MKEMLCSRSSSLIHPFRISKSIRPRISPNHLLIARQTRGVLKMATTETTESTPTPPPLKLSDLKKEAKVLEDYLNLASVANVHSHQPKSKGPISFTVSLPFLNPNPDSITSYVVYLQST